MRQFQNNGSPILLTPSGMSGNAFDIQQKMPPCVPQTPLRSLVAMRNISFLRRSLDVVFSEIMYTFIESRLPGGGTPYV